MSRIYKKTIRYNLSPSYAPPDLIDNVSAMIASGTVHIAENSPTTPVKFTDAMFYTTLQDTSTVTGATLQVNSTFVSASNASLSSYVSLFRMGTQLANSGENWSYTFGPMDGLPAATDFIGQSGSAVLAIIKNADVTTGTGTNTRAAYSWVDLTYEYSASAELRTQTIAIPLPSVTSLPTSLATQYVIPQLSGSGGLLENYGGLSIRSVWIDFKGSNHNPNNNSDTLIVFSWDGGASGVLPTRVNGLSTTLFERYIIPYDRNPNVSHTLELACNVADRYRNFGGLMYVTFTYNPATTTRILNYVTLPVDLVSPLKSLATGPNEYVSYLDIQEPGPITTKAVSLELFNSFPSNSNIALKWDVSASYTQFTQVGTQIAGQFWMMYDRGSGAPLSRGTNKLTFNAYTATANAGSNVSGLIHVLYESAVPSGSVDNANHIIMSLIGNHTGLQYSNFRLFSGSLSIPTPHYSNVSSGLEINTWAGTSSSTYTITIERLPSEGSGSWVEVYSDTALTDAENGGVWIFANTADIYKSFPEEHSSKLDIEQQRKYWYNASPSATRPSAILFANVHHITGSVSGTITGIQSVATASLFRADTQVLQQIQYISGSSFSFPTYLDTVQYYVDVYENDTYKGRSKVDFPSTGFDVSLAGVSSTEHSYTFCG